MPLPSLNPETLLTAWEEAAPESPVRRALILLARVWPHRSPQQWADAPIGVRDASLISLQEALFGSRLDTTAVCPNCGERLELTFGTKDISDAQPALEAAGPLHVETDGCRIEFRVPNSMDLIAITDSGSADPRALLLRRCILSAHRGDSEVEFGTLAPGALTAVVNAMAAADPQAEIRIETECVACSHRWPVLFDIVPYLWSEVEDWACRLLNDVHSLASAYGWSERDILSLSPQRRRHYLDLVGG